MNLVALRAKNADHVLKKRFIKRVLTTEGNAILQEQKKRVQGFRTPSFHKTSMNVTDFSVSLQFAKLHRFVDMKTRKTKYGQIISKKNHPIYNKIIFGQLNNIISEISFGYTDTVIEEMKKLENI